MFPLLVSNKTVVLMVRSPSTFAVGAHAVSNNAISNNLFMPGVLCGTFLNVPFAFADVVHAQDTERAYVKDLSKT